MEPRHARTFVLGQEVNQALKFFGVVVRDTVPEMNFLVAELGQRARCGGKVKGRKAWGSSMIRTFPGRSRFGRRSNHRAPTVSADARSLSAPGPGSFSARIR